MSDYVLLYNGGKVPEGAEAEKSMAAWIAWFQGLGDKLVSQGMPFTPNVKSITSMGKVTNSPIGSMVNGYSIIKADSIDAAVALARSCPVLMDGGDISVYETIDHM